MDSGKWTNGRTGRDGASFTQLFGVQNEFILWSGNSFFRSCDVLIQMYFECDSVWGRSEHTPRKTRSHVTNTLNWVSANHFVSNTSDFIRLVKVKKMANKFFVSVDFHISAMKIEFSLPSGKVSGCAPLRRVSSYAIERNAHFISVARWTNQISLRKRATETARNENSKWIIIFDFSRFSGETLSPLSQQRRETTFRNYFGQ